MRTRKPTNGRVKGVRFTIDAEKNTDLKQEKAKLLKELEEKEKNNKEWYDKEIDKHLK